MPKGADLHAHGGAMIPVRNLIDFIKSRNDILVDADSKHKGFLLLRSKKPGPSYMTLQKALDCEAISEAELQKMWTLAGCSAGTHR